MASLRHHSALRAPGVAGHRRRRAPAADAEPGRRSFSEA
jgi:hypothetical protein